MRIWHGEQELERAQAPHAQLPVVARRGQPAVLQHYHRGDARAVLCRSAIWHMRHSEAFADAQTFHKPNRG